MSFSKEIAKRLAGQLGFVVFVLIIWFLLGISITFNFVILSLIIKCFVDQAFESVRQNNQKLNFEQHALNQEEDLSQIRRRLISLESFQKEQKESIRYKKGV